MDTSLRVKGDTYESVVKCRGAFEQTFGRRLSLDETVFLASQYINIAYEEYQKLEQKHLIKTVLEKDGTLLVKWTELGKIVTEVLPRLMTAFGNLRIMLYRKSIIAKVT